MSDETYGKLREKAHRKKKVDVWTFYSPFTDKAARETAYVATIEMVNDNRDGLKFRALSTHFRPPLEDSDIKRLRKKVEEAFRTTDMAARQIRWDDWIELEMDEEFTFKDDNAATLSLKWRVLKRGVHPETGKAYTINNNGVVVEFPKPKAAGENDQPKDDKWHLGSRNVDTQFSYIPATPKNVAALESLAGRIRDARDRLRGLLDQKTAQKSLALGGQLFLEDKS